MKKYTDTKIGKIINEHFDIRLETALFYYILDKGIEVLKQITDEDIENVEGDAFVAKEVYQAMMKCAREITIECTQQEIIEYIRLFLSCKPYVETLEIYADDYKDKETYGMVLDALDVDEVEIDGNFTIFAIVDDSTLKEM